MSNEPIPRTEAGSTPTGLALTWLANVATPAIILGASTAYYAGTVYQDTILNSLGVPPGVIQRSIQQVMASGYTALLRTVIVFVISGLAVFIAKPWIERLAIPYVRQSTSERGRRYFGVLYVGYITLLFAGIGFVAGRTAGWVEYRSTFERLHNGCVSCFVYYSDKGFVVGTPVIADSAVTVLATRSGVAIIPTGKIKKILPINPRQPVSRWIAP